MANFEFDFETFTRLKIVGSIQPTGKVLGAGSDATVFEVDWNGTLCAAKELHEILLRDQSPGGARHFITNFMKECRTWSTLRHPQIVQFLGLHFKKEFCVPILIMEKMDISLRYYLEKYTKKEFGLPDKIYILRQVAQALSYLHSHSPPLVHHDLSSNNILLNEVSLQAKVTDFGMTRAMDSSKMSCRSSVKGTEAFMAPEALQKPPQYNDKLDVFSYGNVIITTVTHRWPQPDQPTRYEGGILVGVSELQRRESYIAQFFPVHNNLFLSTVHSCLENSPHKRPNSQQLVTRLKKMELSHPRVSKESINEQIQIERDQLHRDLENARVELKRVIDDNGVRYAALLQEYRQHQSEHKVHVHQPPKNVATKHVKNWKDGNFQKILSCGNRCQSIATTKYLIAVCVPGSNIKIYSKLDNKLQYEIGQGQLGSHLLDVAFYKDNILVSDATHGSIKVFSIQGHCVNNIGINVTSFLEPRGIATTPEGYIYVCDGGSHCVHVCHVKGKLLSSFGSLGSGDENFNNPQDLCFDGNGFLYITDKQNGRICVYREDGTMVRAFATVHKPECIDITNCGHLIVTSREYAEVMIYTTGGDLVHVIGQESSELKQFLPLCAITVDKDGSIYTAESNNVYLWV